MRRDTILALSHNMSCKTKKKKQIIRYAWIQYMYLIQTFCMRHTDKVFITEREREGERERERERERETHLCCAMHTGRQTRRQTRRETQTETQTVTQTEHRQTSAHMYTHTHS